MWFKNLQIFRIPAPWGITPHELADFLVPQAFQPGSSMDMQTQGWMSPRENESLVYSINQQMLIVLGTEKKLLPTSVINQVTKSKAAELEEQQGFKPGRKQMKDLKEQVTDELLPRAFSIQRKTWTWIDPVNGWLVIDAASPGKADEVIKLLLKSVPKMTLESLHVAESPVGAMTNWLVSDEAPTGFTVDQDTELRSSGEAKATVRYVRQSIEADDVQKHIAAGKQCTRLAMTWADKISFVLTESLTLKRISPLDVIKEANEATSKNDDERFDADMMLMTGEMALMLADLVNALGGEMQRQ
ncbi:MAG: recombination-associated protein RdgC [Pseudomonadota bacterium]